MSIRIPSSEVGESCLDVIGLTILIFLRGGAATIFSLGCKFTEALQMLNVEGDVRNGKLWIEVLLNLGVAAAAGNSYCARPHHRLNGR